MTRAMRTALAFVATSAVSFPTRAQEFVAVDGSLAEGSGHWGFNADARVGYRTGLGRGWLYAVLLQPEIVGGYRQLFASTGDFHMGRLGIGLRGGASIYLLQLLPFVHVSAADANGNWGVLVDFGGAIDWRFKWWSLGSHYAHAFLHTDAGWQEFNEVGVHVEFRGFWLE